MKILLINFYLLHLAELRAFALKVLNAAGLYDWPSSPVATLYNNILVALTNLEKRNLGKWKLGLHTGQM